jgi:hypothetical protein
MAWDVGGVLATRALPGGVRAVIVLDDATRPAQRLGDLTPPHRLDHDRKSSPSRCGAKAGLDMKLRHRWQAER